jgi:hypothetical protein
MTKPKTKPTLITTSDLPAHLESCESLLRRARDEANKEETNKRVAQEKEKREGIATLIKRFSEFGFTPESWDDQKGGFVRCGYLFAPRVEIIYTGSPYRSGSYTVGQFYPGLVVNNHWHNVLAGETVTLLVRADRHSSYPLGKVKTLAEFGDFLVKEEEARVNEMRLNALLKDLDSSPAPVDPWWKRAIKWVLHLPLGYGGDGTSLV